MCSRKHRLACTWLNKMLGSNRSNFKTCWILSQTKFWSALRRLRFLRWSQFSRTVRCENSLVAIPWTTKKDDARTKPVIREEETNLLRNKALGYQSPFSSAATTFWRVILAKQEMKMWSEVVWACKRSSSDINSKSKKVGVARKTRQLAPSKSKFPTNTPFQKPIALKLTPVWGICKSRSLMFCTTTVCAAWSICAMSRAWSTAWKLVLCLPSINLTRVNLIHQGLTTKTIKASSGFRSSSKSQLSSRVASSSSSISFMTIVWAPKLMTSFNC